MAPVEGRNVRSMFITSCLAVIFGLKLLVFSQLYRVPKYIGSHYGITTKKLVPKLELLQQKEVRHKEAIVFLEKCSIYNLRPKFLRFRLYKPGLTDSAAACKFRRTLLLKEIKFHKGKIKATQHDMTLRIQEVRNKVSSFTAILVNRFLQRVKKKEENTVQLNLRKKLKNLGLVETSPVDVVHNLSNRILTEA